MLTLTLETPGLKRKDILSSSRVVKKYLSDIHSRKQGFLELAESSGPVVKDILSYAKRVDGKFEHVVVLGIGGSALGVTALTDAIKPHSFGVRGVPELHVLDNIDPELIADLDRALPLRKTLFVVISKSGATPETVAQYIYYKERMKKAVGKTSFHEHFVVVTDALRGYLREEVSAQGYASFPIPENVGGRFSVLSAVGLLPAALLGIDIVKLLKGARKGVDLFLSSDAGVNQSYQLARTQYLLQQRCGVDITVMMAYASALYSVADWYRQLLAESIGKALDSHGKVVHTGLTPIKALGPTDQHSQIQLYNEGPNDKFILFLTSKAFRTKVAIPRVDADANEFSFLSGRSFGDLMQAEQRATQMALSRYGRATGNLLLERISEETLGELFVMLEGSIAFLGEMYSIDAYNQPGVELGKVLTKKMMLALK